MHCTMSGHGYAAVDHLHDTGCKQRASQTHTLAVGVGYNPTQAPLSTMVASNGTLNRSMAPQLECTQRACDKVEHGSTVDY